MRVDVYRNLHKKCWSVKSVATGRVVAHRSDVTVENASFIVRPAGRARVLREMKKNVHAFIRGEWRDVWLSLPLRESPIEISYNPYRMGCFYETESGESVTHRSLVSLTSEGRVYI
jgi:hypothetical protein